MTDFRADLERLHAILDRTLKARAVNASFAARTGRVGDPPDFAAQLRGDALQPLTPHRTDAP